MKLFGTSGIRGVYGEKITPELALEVGLALGTHLGGGKVLIARDVRRTSFLLENSLASGLESTGCAVTRLGMCPTPVLAFSVNAQKVDAGVMITASHNPPEYNGIKLWNADSSAFSPEREKEIEALIEKKEYALRKWENIKNSTSFDPFESYSSFIDSRITLKTRHKITIDCGGGAACGIAPQLFENYAEVEHVFCEEDPDFSCRPSEPAEKNLTKLSYAVKNSTSVLGFAFDGDSDRLAVADETGKIIDKDKLLALLALNALEKGKGKVVVPIDTSMLVEEVVEKAGGSVVFSRVGDVDVANILKKENGVFGGEPSGSFIFPGAHYAPDGLLAAFKFLEYVEKTGKKASELESSLPSYYTIREKIHCAENEKQKTLDLLYNKVRSLKNAEIIEMDGVRANLEDAWVLVRPSGTEPIVRITVETEERERAEELLKEVRGRP